MATPLTVCLVVVGQHVPQFRFFAVLLGDEPALAPRMRYYQRLLARDQHEAASLVKALMRESHQLSQICDQVLLPALVRTRKDRMRELIAAEDEAFVLQATRDIVNELTQSHSSIKGELLGGFGTAATAGQPCVAANGHVAATATLGSTDDTNDVEQASKPRLCILGCPSHHEAEEAAIHMLSAVLVDHGYNLHALTTKTLPTELINIIRQHQPKGVFLAVIPPSGFSQASYLCRRLRRTFPKLPIVVGYWGKKTRFDEVLVKLRSRGASFVTTSIGQSQKQITALIETAPSAAHRSPERNSIHATDSDN